MDMTTHSIPTPAFDAVICVGVKDLFIVKKVVHYMQQNIAPHRIFLILNRRFFKMFSAAFRSAYSVTLLDETEIVPEMDVKRVRVAVNEHFTQNFRGGWYYQQFLKIGFSRSPYAGEYYLIWDADTLPTSPLGFFNEDGQMLITQKDEYHTPYFETMRRLIGLDKEVDFSFIAEHMMIKSAVMRELIDVFDRYEPQSHKPWWQKVIDATPVDQGLSFSEFETYGTYCHHFHPDLYAYRRLHTFRRAGMLFGRMMHDYEIQEFRGVTDTLSLEAGHIPHFPRNLYQYLQLAFLRLFRP